jgi:hypothetical protein
MLARDLVAQGMSCVVTVTTAAARRLYPDTERCRVWVGRLTTETVGEFLQTHSIRAVLDASHPFATAVSELAIATAAHFHLPYLRFERSPVEAVSSEAVSAKEWVFPNFEALLSPLVAVSAVAGSCNAVCPYFAIARGASGGDRRWVYARSPDCAAPTHYCGFRNRAVATVENFSCGDQSVWSSGRRSHQAPGCCGSWDSASYHCSPHAGLPTGDEGSGDRPSILPNRPGRHDALKPSVILPAQTPDPAVAGPRR